MQPIDPSLAKATLRELLTEVIREEIQPAALSCEAAAHYIGVSERTMKRLSAERRIPCVRIGTRMVRFRVADLDAFLEKHRVGVRAKAR